MNAPANLSALLAADPCLDPALRAFLRSLPHAEIVRGSDRWQALRDDIRREADECDALDNQGDEA